MDTTAITLTDVLTRDLTDDEIVGMVVRYDYRRKNERGRMVDNFAYYLNTLKKLRFTKGLPDGLTADDLIVTVGMRSPQIGETNRHYYVFDVFITARDGMNVLTISRGNAKIDGISPAEAKIGLTEIAVGEWKEVRADLQNRFHAEVVPEKVPTRIRKLKAKKNEDETPVAKAAAPVKKVRKAKVIAEVKDPIVNAVEDVLDNGDFPTDDDIASSKECMNLMNAF